MAGTTWRWATKRDEDHFTAHDVAREVEAGGLTDLDTGKPCKFRAVYLPKAAVVDGKVTSCWIVRENGNKELDVPLLVCLECGEGHWSPQMYEGDSDDITCTCGAILKGEDVMLNM